MRAASLILLVALATLAASDTISKFEFQGFQNIFPLEDVVDKVIVIIDQHILTFNNILLHRLWTWAT